MVAKAKIFGFATFIKVCQINIYNKHFFCEFQWLKKEVTDAAVFVIVDNLKIIAPILREDFQI